MKIFEGLDKEKKLVYIEIPAFFFRSKAVKIIKKIPGVEMLQEKKRDDVFCTFKLGERIFELMEPWGDNSRYHISEKEAQTSNELEVIKQALIDY